MAPCIILYSHKYNICKYVVLNFNNGNFSLDQQQKQPFLQAIKMWENVTCLKFRTAAADDMNYILFTNYYG